MAKVKFKAPIKSIHGRIGNVIFYNVNGYNYARSWSIPENPRTDVFLHKEYGITGSKPPRMQLKKPPGGLSGAA